MSSPEWPEKPLSAGIHNPAYLHQNGIPAEKVCQLGLRSVFVYVRDGGFALPSCPKSRENETANIGPGAQLLFLPGGLKIEKNKRFFSGKEALLLKERSDT